MATDPICGMYVDPGPGSLSLVRENRTFYFCSTACLQSFASPENERRRLGRRLGIAWPLTVAVVALTYGVDTRDGAILSAVLAAAVQFYCGSQFYAGARDALRQRTGNMDLLVAIATSAAFFYSAAALFLPARLPTAYYFDASSLIVALLLTGNYLEHLTRSRAGSALRRLSEMLPTEAVVVRADRESSVRVDEIAVGDRLIVPPGGRFPVDGTVRAGASTADESLLTGEGHPVRKGPGNPVLAGSRNLEGRLEIVATSTGPDTFLAQIGGLLTDAELSRVPLRRLADRLATVFVPVVLSLAVAAALFWALLGGASLPVAVLVFVTVAITACPCAFGIATPAAIVVGTGRAADEGILFRGEDALERAARIDWVLTDKTGTLTSPSPEVSSIVAIAPRSDRDVLAIAAGLEAGVDHPLAAAVTAAASVRGVTPLRCEEVRLDPGRGVAGTAGGRHVGIVRELLGGGPRDAGPLATWVREVEARGESWSLVDDNGAVAGAISFRTPLAAGAAESIRLLHADGVGVAVVTGDHEAAARRVAAALGIDELHPNASPADKVAIVHAASDRGRHVAFVGDGVNDAPALAAAELGVAIGTGTDVAREAGQVLLVRPDLLGVPKALRIARATVRRVRWNLGWAIGYNLILLPIAAGALVPFLGFAVYAYLPVLGALAMALSSTTVVLNSLSLRRVDLGAAAARLPDPPRGVPPAVS